MSRWPCKKDGTQATKMGSWIWNCRPLCAPEVHRGQHSQQPHQPQGGCEGVVGFAVSPFFPLHALHVAGELQAGHAGQQAVCSWGAHAGLGGLDAAWQSRLSSFNRCLRLGFQGWAAGVWPLFWDIHFVAEERTRFFFFSKIDVCELYRLTPHFPCFGISWWRKGRSGSDVTSS